MTGIGKVATVNMSLVAILLIVVLIHDMCYPGPLPQWIDRIFMIAGGILTFPVFWLLAIFIPTDMPPSVMIPFFAFVSVSNAYLWGWIVGRKLDASRKTDQPPVTDATGKPVVH